MLIYYKNLKGCYIFGSFYFVLRILELPISLRLLNPYVNILITTGLDTLNVTTRKSTTLLRRPPQGHPTLGFGGSCITLVGQYQGCRSHYKVNAHQTILPPSYVAVTTMKYTHCPGSAVKRSATVIMATFKAYPQQQPPPPAFIFPRVSLPDSHVATPHAPQPPNNGLARHSTQASSPKIKPPTTFVAHLGLTSP